MILIWAGELILNCLSRVIRNIIQPGWQLQTRRKFTDGRPEYTLLVWPRWRLQMIGSLVYELPLLLVGSGGGLKWASVAWLTCSSIMRMLACTGLCVLSSLLCLLIWLVGDVEVVDGICTTKLGGGGWEYHLIIGLLDYNITEKKMPLCYPRVLFFNSLILIFRSSL